MFPKSPVTHPFVPKVKLYFKYSKNGSFCPKLWSIILIIYGRVEKKNLNLEQVNQDRQDSIRPESSDWKYVNPKSNFLCVKNGGLDISSVKMSNLQNLLSKICEPRLFQLLPCVIKSSSSCIWLFMYHLNSWINGLVTLWLTWKEQHSRKNI